MTCDISDVSRNVSMQPEAATEFDLSRLIDEQKPTSLQVRVVAVCAAVAFCDSFSIQAVNYAGPVLRDALALSTGQLGAVFSLSLLGMMLGSFAIGPVADRLGRRTPMALLTIAFGLITACTALATEFWHLAAFRLLDGLALGAALPNATVLTAEYSPKRNRRLTLGLIAIGYTCGGFMAGVAGGPLIARHGWEAIFVLGGVAALATGVAALLFVPDWGRRTLLLGDHTGRRDCHSCSVPHAGVCVQILKLRRSPQLESQSLISKSAGRWTMIQIAKLRADSAHEDREFRPVMRLGHPVE